MKHNHKEKVRDLYNRIRGIANASNHPGLTAACDDFQQVLNEIDGDDDSGSNPNNPPPPPPPPGGH